MTRDQIHQKKLECLAMRIYDLIKRGWTQKASARVDKKGPSCGWSDPKAACWCLTGALSKATTAPTFADREYHELAGAYRDAITKRFHYHGSIVNWNDAVTTKKPMVLRVCLDVIKSYAAT